MSNNKSNNNNNNNNFNPLNNIIIDKKTQSNLTNLTNLTKNNFLIRVNVSFYLNKNINDSWRRYCKLSGQDGCWLLEEALITFMKENPLHQVQINVTQDIRSIIPNKRNELKLQLVKTELKKTIEFLEKIKEREPKLVSNNLGRLRKSLNRALQCKTSDEELDLLFEKAKEFLGD